jgi:hypothetical protein
MQRGEKPLQWVREERVRAVLLRRTPVTVRLGGYHLGRVYVSSTPAICCFAAPALVSEHVRLVWSRCGSAEWHHQHRQHLAFPVGLP